jgi:ABC-type nickel/cobalt efflux system permease component RcnA
VPSPEKSSKSKYGILLMALLVMLVGMLITVNKMEHRVKAHVYKSHILTHLHEHHHGTQVSPEASHIKDIDKTRLKLLLMNIAHIIIIIVIIGVIYCLIR